jgi:hypothetical protein
VASDIRKEELQAVRGTGDGLGLVLGLGSCFFVGLRVVARGADLDGVRLELALKQLRLLLAEVVLDDERLEVCRLQVSAVLLAALDERLHVLGLKQFDELVLRQLGDSILSARLGGKPAEQQTSLSLRGDMGCFQGDFTLG